MYVKLFASILESSIWLESAATCKVWVTLLASMDEDGFCRYATIENLASRAHLRPCHVRSAIAILEAPDKNSSDPENDGKRLERIPGGWRVMNCQKYRQISNRFDQREAAKLRMRKHREKAAPGSDATRIETFDDDSTCFKMSHDVLTSPVSLLESRAGYAPVTPSEAEVKAEAEVVPSAAVPRPHTYIKTSDVLQSPADAAKSAASPEGSQKTAIEGKQESRKTRRKPTAIELFPSSPTTDTTQTQKSKPGQDFRHQETRLLIAGAYRAENGVDCPWGPAEAGQLGRFLKENPTWGIPEIARAITNRFASEASHTESPRLWIGRLASYLNGALDRYGKPLDLPIRRKPNAAEQRDLNNAEACRRAAINMGLASDEDFARGGSPGWLRTRAGTTGGLPPAAGGNSVREDR